MVFKYLYWYYNNVSRKFIDNMLAIGKSSNLSEGQIGLDNNYKGTIKNDKRKSKVSFFNEWWINKEITPFINDANHNAGWKLQLNEIEPSQFTYYDSTKSFYDWHQDSFEGTYTNHEITSLNGKIRKLSSIVSLSNGDEYEGGDLEFAIIDGGEKKIVKANELKNKGTIIIFPSHIFHRVTPVTKGNRYSLVSWVVGDQFK